MKRKSTPRLDEPKLDGNLAVYAQRCAHYLHSIKIKEERESFLLHAFTLVRDETCGEIRNAVDDVRSNISCLLLPDPLVNARDPYA